MTHHRANCLVGEADLSRQSTSSMRQQGVIDRKGDTQHRRSCPEFRPAADEMSSLRGLIRSFSTVSSTRDQPLPLGFKSKVRCHLCIQTQLYANEGGTTTQRCHCDIPKHGIPASNLTFISFGDAWFSRNLNSHCVLIAAISRSLKDNVEASVSVISLQTNCSVTLVVRSHAIN